jgi:hypothetical protein
LPAQFLHSQKSPDYLQLNQLDTKVLSPAQDDKFLGNQKTAAAHFEPPLFLL